MPKLFCEKCNKEMEDSNFYTYKNGNKTESTESVELLWNGVSECLKDR